MISGITRYNESDQLSLVCRQGNVPPITSMLWLRHSEVITSPRASITSASDDHSMLLTLELKDLVPGDSDEYSCQVSSSTLGVKTTSVDVTVNGKRW